MKALLYDNRFRQRFKRETEKGIQKTLECARLLRTHCIINDRVIKSHRIRAIRLHTDSSFEYHLSGITNICVYLNYLDLEEYASCTAMSAWILENIG